MHTCNKGHLIYEMDIARVDYMRLPVVCNEYATKDSELHWLANWGDGTRWQKMACRDRDLSLLYSNILYHNTNAS